MLPEFTLGQWLLAGVAALGIGVSKSGLPGVSLLHVVIMASLFSARESTGIVLPMLVFGDLCAVAVFRRHTRWVLLTRTLPPAVVGVGVGWWILGQFRHFNFSPAIGSIVFVLALMQFVRDWQGEWFEKVPHSRLFAWVMGFVAGVTTMLANAAGPVMGLYLLAISLPKKEFVGTSAWFFLIINLIKVPFSAQLGLINPHTLRFNLLLLPLIALGLFLGKSVVSRLSQKLFDSLVLVFAIVAALKLIGAF